MTDVSADSNADEEEAQSADFDSTEETSDASPLTITLPDGSESVSDAIITHRAMLSEPQEHGLATGQDITHLSEAVEGLSADVEEISQQYDENQSTVAELQDRIERQQRQIDELQSMVTSLAEILGTGTEWETFDET
ncbi:MAG: hypothetical protein ABEJ78_03020 [Haloferacaceae archaeon]